MTRSRSLAVAQTCPVSGDVQANLDEHVQLAQLAADQGARLVVFPELSLIGYELALADELAFSETDARLSPLLEVATSRDVTLVVGAPVRLGPSLAIGAFILSPDGATNLYTKQRLGAFPPGASCDSCEGTIPPAEATVFRAGDRNPLIRIEDQVAAVAVCADIGRAEHAALAAERGADTYLASMFVIPSEFDGDAARLSRYAREHRLLTALANFGSPSGSLRSAGRSSIWSDAGELLVQLEREGSGVAVVSETPQGRRTAQKMLGLG